MKTISIALLAIAAATPAAAQTKPAAPAAVPAVVMVPVAAPIIGASANGNAVLRTGTELPLKLSEPITTKDKKLKMGQRVHLEVAEPVLVNGVVVVPAGSPAMAEITEVRNKGMWGKSGHFTGRVLYATVNGRQVRLSGGFDDKGVTGTAGVVGAIALVPIAGFFMTGTSAQLPAGAPVKSFLDEDVELGMAASAATPLAVSATPAQPTMVPVSATVQR